MARPGRRAEILQTAKHLFGTKGYHATTVRDIAGDVRMQPGSLYAHVSSKLDLLYEVMEEGAGRFLSALEPIARSRGPAAERLRRALEAHLGVICEHLGLATVFFSEWKTLDAERRRLIQEKRDRYEAMLGEIIADGVRSGEFGPVDQKFARLLVLSAANWAYQWYSPHGPLSQAEIAYRFASLILDGLRPRPAAGPPPPEPPHAKVGPRVEVGP